MGRPAPGWLPLIAALFNGCADSLGTSVEPPPIAVFRIAPDSIILNPGTNEGLSLAVADSIGTPLSDSGVVWSSSDTAIAIVDSYGRVGALAPGRATITADLRGARAQSAVRVVLDFREAAAGSSFTCGIIVTGATYCWGSSYGYAFSEATIGIDTVPLLLANVPPLVSLTAGSRHACGLTDGGEAFCWGANEVGQLGSGTQGPRFGPRPVVGGIRFRSISAGESHTCGVSLAGVGHCWGSDFSGVLGDGPGEVMKASPALVAGGRTWLRIDAGDLSTCGITTDGVAYCWGNNSRGELGLGYWAFSDRHPTPEPVIGGLLFRSISVGDHSFACGLTVAGEIYCWGHNDAYQLGRGEPRTRAEPTPAPVAGAQGYAEVIVDAAGFHACGIKTDGRAECWGVYPGSAGSTVSPVPVQVEGQRSFLRLSAGLQHTCALTTAYELLCWGPNYNGELGNGTRQATSVPLRVEYQRGIRQPIP